MLLIIIVFLALVSAVTGTVLSQGKRHAALGDFLFAIGCAATILVIWLG